MNFTFKLRLAAVIAGMLVLGCNISSSPVVVRIDGIQVAPGRLTLVPSQAADLSVDIITSRGEADAAPFTACERAHDEGREDTVEKKVLVLVGEPGGRTRNRRQR